jgi:hypothetical protein
MDKLIQFFTEHFGPKFLIGLAISSAVATSGVTGAKIITSMNEPQSAQEIPEVRVENESLNSTGDTGTESISDIDRSTGSTGVSGRIPGSRGASSSFPIAPTPIPTIKSSVNANACVITLFGVQYDVAKLRKSHSGGDVFACNTDMSTAYQNRHGTNVSRMQAYLFTSGSSGATGATGTGSSFSNSDSEDEDHMSEQEKQEIEHERESRKQSQEQTHKEDD